MRLLVLSGTLWVVGGLLSLLEVGRYPVLGAFLLSVPLFLAGLIDLILKYTPEDYDESLEVSCFREHNC